VLMDNDQFCSDFLIFAEEVFHNSVEHGFWEGEQKHPAIKLALIHSEVSEWLEATRIQPKASEKIPEFTLEDEEAADLFIRLLDLCFQRDINLVEAALAKHEYNKGRPKMHGKKF